ncbi:hypothetical protein JCM5353_008434 [Sporobolomyces roseus]
MPLERTNPLLLSYTQLKELHVDSGYRAAQDIHTSLLAALPCLESVALHRTKIIFIAQHPPLLALKHLTLSQCYGNFDALFAQPSILPSLKVLALLDDREYHEPIYNNYLLPQLDLFIGKPRSLEEKVLQKHGDKVLSAYTYDHYISGHLDHPNVQHLRLSVSSVDLETTNEVEDLCETLNTIQVHLSKYPFKTLFLDKGLRDALDPFRFTQVTYDKLIKTCEENGTEVILEEQAVIDSADSAVTPELLRWMARRKRELEDERK